MLFILVCLQLVFKEVFSSFYISNWEKSSRNVSTATYLQFGNLHAPGFSNKADIFFLQCKITVKNTVGGIVDSSHVFKGMGFVKLLEKNTYIIGFLLTFVETAFSVNVVCLLLW